jgi:hypothetical protein
VGACGTQESRRVIKDLFGVREARGQNVLVVIIHALRGVRVHVWHVVVQVDKVVANLKIITGALLESDGLVAILLVEYQLCLVLPLFFRFLDAVQEQQPWICVVASELIHRELPVAGHVPGGDNQNLLIVVERKDLDDLLVIREVQVDDL